MVSTSAAASLTSCGPRSGTKATSCQQANPKYPKAQILYYPPPQYLCLLIIILRFRYRPINISCIVL